MATLESLHMITILASGSLSRALILERAVCLLVMTSFEAPSLSKSPKFVSFLLEKPHRKT